jgi:hypothetical protein
VGKDADLVLYDKYPLSDYAKVEKVLIDGQLYFDRATDVAERPERESGEEEADGQGERRAKEKRASRAWEAGSMKTHEIGLIAFLTRATAGGVR